MRWSLPRGSRPVSSTAKVTPGGYATLPRVVDRILGPLEGIRPLAFDPDAMMRAASRSTGLDDFGSEDFREALEILTADLRAAPPSPLGRAMMVATFTQALVNRLKITEEWKRRHYDPVTAPLMIVGWHRTGTTFLHNLLDAIPGFGYIPLYRLINPVPNPTEKLRAFMALHFGFMVAPEMPKLHPMAIDGPEECWMMMFGGFQVEGVTMHWNVPSYTEYLSNCDFRPAYRLWAKALAIVQKVQGHDLILKDPAHLVALEAISDVIPDARMVWTHRDPVRAVASFASLSVIHHRSMYGVYDPERSGRTSIERFIHAIERGLQARETLPQGQLLDVPYPEMMADPVAAVRKICEHFDIPWDNRARTAVADRLTYMRANRPPKHVYGPEQWGIEPGELLERLQDIGYDPEFYR